MHVGNNIRRLRKAQRLSQGAVATMGGFDRPYISRVETGKQTPSLKFLGRLANILNLPMAEFFIYPVTAVSDDWLEEHNRERLYIDLPILDLTSLGTQRERDVPTRTQRYDGLVARIQLDAHRVEFPAPSPDVFAVGVPEGTVSQDISSGDVLVIDPAASATDGDLVLVEPTPGAPAEIRLAQMAGETTVYTGFDRLSTPMTNPAHVWGRVIEKIRHY